MQRPLISSTPEPEPTAAPAVAPATTTTGTTHFTNYNEPKSPGSHPSTIDRAGLVGVGDLTTPRWTTRAEITSKSQPWKGSDHPMPGVDEDIEHIVPLEPIPDATQDQQETDVDRSSPWTIEAVDESDTNEPSSYVSAL